MTNFRWPVRVYYEDTDAGGVVYYANYLRFFERARTERLRTLGFEQDAVRLEDGILFAVRSINVDYLLPALFNERLQVSADLVEIKRASIIFQQEIFRADDGILLCKATVRIACLDEQELRPRSIPESMFQRIKNDL